MFWCSVFVLVSSHAIYNPLTSNANVFFDFYVLYSIFICCILFRTTLKWELFLKLNVLPSLYVLITWVSDKLFPNIKTLKTVVPLSTCLLTWQRKGETETYKSIISTLLAFNMYRYTQCKYTNSIIFFTVTGSYVFMHF